jgi:ribonucleoside-diphosphate reductase alpha chain
LIAKHGQRNSLTLSLMPTASTSSITGFSPAFEPHNALVYKRKDKLGESYVCNKDLQHILMRRGLWTEEVRGLLMKSRTGSIQEIMSLPKQIRELFKTAYDMSPKVILNHALIRGPHIDQSQSKNVFMIAADHQKLTQIAFYDWKRGSKTACYYLRQLPSVDAKKIQLTEPRSPKKEKVDEEEAVEVDEDGEVCTMKDGCIVCSS